MRVDQKKTQSSLQGFNAKEESYRNEVKMMKQEMESLANIKNQELQSLRFEISSAEIQYQTAANVSFIVLCIIICIVYYIRFRKFVFMSYFNKLFYSLSSTCCYRPNFLFIFEYYILSFFYQRCGTIV